MTSFFRLNDEDEGESCFPSLGYRERIMGFAVCLGLGKNLM